MQRGEMEEVVEDCLLLKLVVLDSNRASQYVPVELARPYVRAWSQSAGQLVKLHQRSQVS
jgi:hypothetical protein